jgi:sphingolipid 4-desaturase/C4-monooxygenase
VDRQPSSTEIPQRQSARMPGISAEARRHNAIRRKVLAAHPELARLTGPDWRTWLAAVVLLVVQWTTIWAVSRAPLWAEFLTALFFGQFVYHSAATLAHENAHRLVTRSPRGKFAFDVLLETVVTSFGHQLHYQHRHISSHHPHLGEYETDYEHEDQCMVVARANYRLKHPGRQRLLTAGLLLLDLLPFGFMVESLVVPRLYAREAGIARSDRDRHTGESAPSRGERLFFFLYAVAINILFFVLFGFRGWLYQPWVISLATGRWAITTRGQFLAEHPADASGHSTRSTYWWGNLFLFNTGYHYEHHTFPNVAWMNLPKLRKAAPETFNVANEHAYLGFWWKQLKADFALPARKGPAPGGFAAQRCALADGK